MTVVLFYFVAMMRRFAGCSPAMTRDHGRGRPAARRAQARPRAGRRASARYRTGAVSWGTSSSFRPFVGEQLVRADAVGVVVGDGDDQLVGFGGVTQSLELVGDLSRGADELGVDAVGDQVAVGFGPLVTAGLPRRGELDGALRGADAADP